MAGAPEDMGASNRRRSDGETSGYLPLTREALEMADLDSICATLTPIERMRQLSYTESRGLSSQPLATGTDQLEQPAYVREPDWVKPAKCINFQEDVGSEQDAVGAMISFPRTRKSTCSLSDGVTREGSIRDQPLGYDIESMSSLRSISTMHRSSRKATDDVGHEVSSSNSWKTASLWSAPYGVAAHHSMLPMVGPNGDLLRMPGQPSMNPFPDVAEGQVCAARTEAASPKWGRQDEFFGDKMRKSIPSMIPENSMEFEASARSTTCTQRKTSEAPPGPQQLLGRMQAEARSAFVDEWSTTTLMLKHLPKVYTRDRLCALLDSHGLQGTYDFVYLPVKFSSSTSFGYAFVNFVDASFARRCHMLFDGFQGWDCGVEEEDEPCEVSLNTKHKGLEACIDLYRNSPVMHPSVSDDVKPAIFKQGVRMPFPPPTKKIKPPRARGAADGGD